MPATEGGAYEARVAQFTGEQPSELRQKVISRVVSTLFGPAGEAGLSVFRKVREGRPSDGLATFRVTATPISVRGRVFTSTGASTLATSAAMPIATAIPSAVVASPVPGEGTRMSLWGNIAKGVGAVASAYLAKKYSPAAPAAVAPSTVAAAPIVAAKTMPFSTGGGFPSLPGVGGLVGSFGRPVRRAETVASLRSAGLVGPTGIPRGYHLAKDGSGRMVRNRRMNSLNPRALNRALRRVEGFTKAVKRADKAMRRCAPRRAAPRRRSC